VARALALEPGEIVEAADVARTRRQLYDSGLYRSVRIELEPQGDAPPGGDRPVRARISLEGRPQYRFRYGLALNDEVVGPDERERRLGVAADVENRNLLGLGATAGVSARLRRDQQVGRLFVGANRFFGLPLRSQLFLERGRQEIGTEGFASTISDETGIRAEQGYRLFDTLEVRYGYGFGRNRTVIEGGDFDIRVNISRLTTGGFIDRRRNPFDPTGGWFGSASAELSRPGLGSDLSFLKTYFQALSFRTLREGLVLASAVRLGLARTYEDQELIPGERFFAGGATSVRGYREDDLGPRGILGDADGGQSMLVLNGELRFPLFGRVRGVGFVDAGTVYPSIAEMRLGELQVGLGAGVRVDTPVGLLRLDLGVPANRRSFDPRWRLHLGLGHAF
jgi:outer membrane protein insertion porin family